MLTITLNSFSYKKGYPEETTGNGGGFALDCRGIYNPGRIERYKKQSGKDQEVQDFLINETEMPKFLALVQSLISISIDNYLERGFENLQINFGCTGGQHRSVFATEKTAEFIQLKYKDKVLVVVNHCNECNWVK